MNESATKHKRCSNTECLAYWCACQTEESLNCLKEQNQQSQSTRHVSETKKLQLL